MRLWPYQMLDVLPRQQLLSQLRECTALAVQLDATGKTNHILINKIMDYDLMEFKIYCQLVVDEFKRRNYNVAAQTRVKLGLIGFSTKYPEYIDYPIYKEWHNDRYIKQCMNNLEEKYDCGGVTEEEWEALTRKFGSYV